MDTKTVTYDARKHVQWDFLVKVNGNFLQLNPDALKLTGGADRDNISVVILSVVGQPKSRKTSLMNEIISHFGQCHPVIPLPRCTFPVSSEDYSGYPDIHGQEGILVWQYPELVPRNDGTMTTLLFMDIWMECPRAAVYNKLVDCCLSLSSTVIFSEPCDPSPDIYWKPCNSTLSSPLTSFRCSLQLHFLLLTQEPVSDLYVMSDGISWKEQSIATFMKTVAAITGVAAFLSPRCNRVTSTFVPLHTTEDDKSENRQKLGLTKKIMTHCLQDPGEINNETVNMPTIQYWLLQIILSLNGDTVTSSALARQAGALGQVPVQRSPVVHSQSKPYGIGIYVDPKQVCIGVYVNQGVNFEDNIMSYKPSMITFTPGRVSIGQEATSDYDAGADMCYNIFELLHTHKNIVIQVPIEGKTRNIGKEEILSIFFQRIRMNTEMVLSQNVHSCYVAVTGLLSSGAKQMLKTSLTIAGFRENTLIPCTTAMAMSYILKSQDRGSVSKNSHSSVLLAYATSKLVEVASADVTGEEAHLRTLSGDSNIYGRFHPSVWEHVKIATNFPEGSKLLLQKRMKYVLESVISTGKDYKAVVMCCGKDLGPLHQALCNELMKHCPLQSLTKFCTNNDILKVAAALDAIRKQHPDLLSSKVRFPAYHNISPHRMTVKYNNKFHTFGDFNSKTPIQENSVVKAGSAEITIYEKARDSRNEWEVAEYSLQITSQPNTHLVLNLSQEGNLTVGTNPKGLPIATNARSLVGSQCQLISDSIKPLLDALEKRYGLKLPVAEDQRYKAADGESIPVSMVSTQSRNSTEELLRRMKALVEKVKIELEKSKTTSVTVRENIALKIKKCEEFLTMNSVEVKVRQLELAMNNLERAAKLIKP